MVEKAVVPEDADFAVITGITPWGSGFNEIMAIQCDHGDLTMSHLLVLSPQLASKSRAGDAMQHIPP